MTPTDNEATRLHRDLLTDAASRADRLILPPNGLAKRDRQALADTLLMQQLAEAVPVGSREHAWRTVKGQGQGLRIIDQALRCLDQKATMVPTPDAGPSPNEAADTEPETCGDSTVPHAVRTSKQARVCDLLQREEGATIAELMAATGWLPHTTRAALTKLRQSGHTLVKSKRADKTTTYVLAGSMPTSPEIDTDGSSSTTPIAPTAAAVS